MHRPPPSVRTDLDTGGGVNPSHDDIEIINRPFDIPPPPELDDIAWRRTHGRR